MTVTHPWQTTPTELIKQGIEYLRRGTETDRQISFLLLDVGVETLFKTFLSLPKTITGVDSKYFKQMEASESNFYTLVEDIRQAAKHRLSGINLDKVKYYHGIRNKLYHQGDGVVPTSTNLEDYANIAIELLDRLISVDLKSYLFAEQQKKELAERRRVLVEHKLGQITKEIHEHIQKIRSLIIKRLEAGEWDDFGKDIVKKSFCDEAEEYFHKMSDPGAKRWKAGVRRLLDEGVYIIDDDNIPIKRIDPVEFEDYFEFIHELILEEAPVKPFTEEVNNLLNKYNFDFYDWTLAEILYAEDFTEFLLRISNLEEDWLKTISVDEYLAAKQYPVLELDEKLTDDEFDNKLVQMTESDQQILEKLRHAVNKLNSEI